MTADWNTPLLSHVKFPDNFRLKFKTRAKCGHCQEKTQWLLVKELRKDGLHAYWLCWKCQKPGKLEDYYIPEEVLRKHEVNLLDLPTVVERQEEETDK